MKTKYNRLSNQHNSKKHLQSNRDAQYHDKLNRVAEELVELARIRLRDNVLRGVLSGMEDDIRQDAILLALDWYLRQENEGAEHSAYEWCAPRAIAAALQIKKKDYAKTQHDEIHALQSIPAMESGIQQHPALMHGREWPEFILRKMVHTAIKIALKSGRISHANAGIALRIYVDQIPVMKLAEQLKINRSSIYQHLGRVRREIPDIIDGIDVPLHYLA